MATLKLDSQPQAIPRPTDPISLYHFQNQGDVDVKIHAGTSPPAFGERDAYILPGVGANHINEQRLSLAQGMIFYAWAPIGESVLWWQT